MSAEKIIVRLDEERAGRVERAVVNGGLPTEDEVLKVEKLMQASFDELEQIESRVVGIADSDLGEELPSIVSLEEIGTLAILISLIHRYVDDFSQMETKMLERVSTLRAIREEQLTRWAERN
jgi:hypothetical protein